MDYVIHFIGIILFTVNANQQIDGILPAVSGHDAFILFDKGALASSPVNWTLETLPYSQFQYVRLSGESVRFLTTAPAPASPSFLAHIKDDCCPMSMLGLKDKYEDLEHPAHQASHILLMHGYSHPYRAKNGRVDTIVDVKAQDKLVIIATLAAQTRILTLMPNATGGKTYILIGNYPLGGSNPHSTAGFDHYYEMLAFHLFCRTPSKDGACRAHLAAGDLASSAVATPLDILAIDIACSNSYHP